MPESPFPVIVAKTTPTAASTTTPTLAIPDGSNVVGYLVVASFAVGDSGGAKTVTIPAGWTALGTKGAIGNALCTHAAAYRFVDGSEGWDGVGDTIAPTVDVAGEWNAVIHTIREVDGAVAADTLSQGAASHNFPDFNPGWGKRYMLVIVNAAFNSHGNSPPYMASLTEWRSNQQYSGDSVNDTRMLSQAGVCVSNQNDPESAFATAGNDMRGFHILVRGLPDRRFPRFERKRRS